MLGEPGDRVFQRGTASVQSWVWDSVGIGERQAVALSGHAGPRDLQSEEGFALTKR